MKKTITIMLLAAILVSVSACSDSTSSLTAPKEAASISAGSGTIKTGSKADSKASSKPQVEEKILMERDGIKITLKEMNYDGMMGPEIKLLIENNSDKNLGVNADNVAVNGLMQDVFFSSDIEAGKKANTEISFSNSSLKLAGIEKIKDVELNFHFYNPDSYDGLFDSDIVKITTDATDYVQKYDDSGSVVLDQDGYKVVAKKLDSKDSFWGADLYVYVENNTGIKSTLQLRDVSINGFMVDPSFSCTVSPEKKALDSITFLQSDLDDNDIKDITDLEFALHIFDDDFNTILDSNKIKVTF